MIIKIRWMFVLAFSAVLIFVTAPQVYVKAEEQPVADGTYTVGSAIDERYVWDISNASVKDGANLQLWTDNDSNAQKFIFSRQEDGCYIITNVNSGKAVECAGAGTDNGTNIQQSAPNDGDAQRWELIRTESGNYSFVCKCNGKAADVKDGIAAEGSNIQMYQLNQTAAQEFMLVRIKEYSQNPNDADTAVESSDGFYVILTFLVFTVLAAVVIGIGYFFKTRIRFCLLAAVIILCSSLAVVSAIRDRNGSVVETDLSEWKSDFIEYADGWYVDDSILQTNETVDIIYGPYMQIKSGTYSVLIEYECDADQNCLVYSKSQENVFIKTGTAALRARQQKAEYRFTLTEDIENLEMVVRYNGQGYLHIKNIEIHTDFSGLARHMAVILLFLILIDVWLYFRTYIIRNRRRILSIAGITLLASLPLFMSGITHGHDLDFHLLRIEGIAQELQNTRLPVRISSLWMDGYGYPVSVFYGDLLLYLPAVLRVAGFSVITAYKIYVVFLNLGTAVVSYICFQKMFCRDRTALLLSLVYVTAAYRIVDIYVRAAAGEYGAMLFFPLIALALYRTYVQESTDRHMYRKNACILAAGMAGLVCTHVLSTEMVVFVLVIICVVCLKKTLRKHTIQMYLWAVFDTVILGAWFIVPFLDYFLHADVIVKNNTGVSDIQWGGAYLMQYFAFFQNMFGGNSRNLTDRLQMTPGVVLMLAFVAAVWMWTDKKASKEMKCLTVISAAVLFVASNLFPWDYLAKRLQGKSILVDFPWRFIGLAAASLTVLLGCVLEQYRKIRGSRAAKKVCMLFAGMCVFMSCWFVSDYADHAYRIVYYYETPELSTYNGRGYLRTGTDTGLFSGKIIGEDMEEVSVISRNGCCMEVYCKTGDRKGSVQLPILNYEGYCAVDEYGNQYEITDGVSNTVKFKLPPQYSGKVTVDFAEPWYWRLSELISAAAVLYLLVRFRKKAQKEVQSGGVQ